MLKDWIGEAIENHPLLLTGDFNADKNSLAYQRLTLDDPLLIDVFKSGDFEHGNEGTYHGYGKETQPASIDWILVSGHFKILGAEIDRYHEGNLFPSDHYPIITTLDWLPPS